jgi:hypothetical protein
MGKIALVCIPYFSHLFDTALEGEYHEASISVCNFVRESDGFCAQCLRAAKGCRRKTARPAVDTSRLSLSDGVASADLCDRNLSAPGSWSQAARAEHVYLRHETRCLAAAELLQALLLRAGWSLL